jgi:hypothetical protein
LETTLRASLPRLLDGVAFQSRTVSLRLYPNWPPASRPYDCGAPIPRPPPAAPELDPAETPAALQAVEAELTALGGNYDPDLADAIEVVTCVFPGIRLPAVRKQQ